MEPESNGGSERDITQYHQKKCHPSNQARENSKDEGKQRQGAPLVSPSLQDENLDFSPSRECYTVTIQVEDDRVVGHGGGARNGASPK